MTIAVEDQYFDCSIWLTVLTIKVCSSSGPDSPGGPPPVVGPLGVAAGRHVAVLQRLGEVRQVVLVVGLVGAADRGLRRRRQVGRVRRGGVELERGPGRGVLVRRAAVDVGALRAADRAAAVRRRRGEPALEPAPRDVLGVQQVADVLTGHHALRVGGGVVGVRALVVVRVDVAVGGAVRGDRACVGGLRAGRGDRVTVRAQAGTHVDRALGRGPERGVPVVVAHRVVLRVVPQPGDGVAVEVVHDDPGRAVVLAGGGAVVLLGELDELIHLAAVFGLLLRQVVVVLVTGQRLRMGQPLRVVLIRVTGQQRPDRPVLGDLAVQAVHRRSSGLGVERGAIRVGRVRVGAEVVVERLVLVEDHDEVLDGGRRPVGVAVVARRHRRRGVVTGELRCARRARRGGADRHGGGQGERRRHGDRETEPLAQAPDRWAYAHVVPSRVSVEPVSQYIPPGYGFTAN